MRSLTAGSQTGPELRRVYEAVLASGQVVGRPRFQRLRVGATAAARAQLRGQRTALEMDEFNAAALFAIRRR